MLLPNEPLFHSTLYLAVCYIHFHSQFCGLYPDPCENLKYFQIDVVFISFF